MNEVFDNELPKKHKTLVALMKSNGVRLIDDGAGIYDSITAKKSISGDLSALFAVNPSYSAMRLVIIDESAHKAVWEIAIGDPRMMDGQHSSVRDHTFDRTNVAYDGKKPDILDILCGSSDVVLDANAAFTLAQRVIDFYKSLPDWQG